MSAADQADMFVATLEGLSLDEAMANLELDAKSYGWPRILVRQTAARVRAVYTRRERK